MSPQVVAGVMVVILDNVELSGTTVAPLMDREAAVGDSLGLSGGE